MVPVRDVAFAGTVTATVAEPLPLVCDSSIHASALICQLSFPLSSISRFFVWVSVQSNVNDWVTSISGISLSSLVAME